MQLFDHHNRNPDDLTWIAAHLVRRVREADPLTLTEMRQLAAMLEAIRDGVRDAG